MTAAKTINPIAFFNIIQEGDENDVSVMCAVNSSISMLVLLIVERRRSTRRTIFGMPSVFPLVIIPTATLNVDTINTPTTTAVVCATLSHMNESWDKDQLLCLYGNSTYSLYHHFISREEMHICQEFFSKLSPRLHFFLLSDYSAFQAQFPFFTTPALCPHTHGMLPLCLLPSSLYLASRHHPHPTLTHRAADPALLRLLHLCPVTTDRLLSLLLRAQPLPKSALLLETPNLYDPLTQQLVLLAFTRVAVSSPPHAQIAHTTRNDALVRLHDVWPSFSLPMPAQMPAVPAVPAQMPAVPAQMSGEAPEAPMTHSTALDLTDVDWGLRGKESREEEERMMKRILAKLRQLNLQYETPGVSSLELNRNPTLEWAASVMEMLKRVTTTWSVNDIYPLIDYITRTLLTSLSS